MRILTACLFAAFLGPELRSQAVHDHCAGAIPFLGSTLLGSNAGATTGPEPTPGCGTMTGDVWYSFLPPCNGVYTVSTCAAVTDFGTIVAVWDGAGGCGALVPIACSDVCATGAFQGASVTLALNFGHSYYISVGGNSFGTGTFGLSVTLGAAMSLTFFSSTSGTLGYAILEGPGGGTAFVAITPNVGAFPQGWFYGIDIQWLELINEIALGYPFLVPLQPCGSAVVGPFPGLPSGLTLYGVGFGLPAGGTIPSATTPPASGVVP